MSIKLHLPNRLSRTTKGKFLFEVNGNTVGECLNHLVGIIPKMNKALFYETGKALNPYVKVMVNKETADVEGLAKEVKDGDEIHIVIKLN